MTNSNNHNTTPDPFGYRAARARSEHAVLTGSLIATEDARKLAQELAGDGYNIVADFGRDEFSPARLGFGPVRLAFLAEIDALASTGDAETEALRAGLQAYAERQQAEALV